MAEANNSSSESFNSQVVYRCKKCRRIVATQESIVTHERGKGELSFKWSKRSSNQLGLENKPADCTSIFVEPMKWMETCKIKQNKPHSPSVSTHSYAKSTNFFVFVLDRTVQDGHVEEKLVCIGCKARLGSFNWAGMQCSCGAWVNPAFQLHKSRLDECLM